jgi:hypothetical protein
MPDTPYQPIPVAVASEIADKFEKDVVVIFAIDHAKDMTHLTTFGRTPNDKVIAAKFSDYLHEQWGVSEEATKFEDFRSPLEAARVKVAAKRLLEACVAMRATMYSPKSDESVLADEAIKLAKEAGL